METIHLMIVHFPIALLLTATLISGLAVLIIMEMPGGSMYNHKGTIYNAR